MFKEGEKVTTKRLVFEVIKSNADETECLLDGEKLTIPTAILDRLPQAGNRVMSDHSDLAELDEDKD
jgi:hypothetical protein